MARVADQLFREKKAAVLAASTGSMDKNAVVGSDLLSILGWSLSPADVSCQQTVIHLKIVQANMTADATDRLTDDEVKGRASSPRSSSPSLTLRLQSSRLYSSPGTKPPVPHYPGFSTTSPNPNTCRSKNACAPNFCRCLRHSPVWTSLTRCRTWML